MGPIPDARSVFRQLRRGQLPKGADGSQNWARIGPIWGMPVIGVGTGLSLVAFVIAAALLAYRARLTHRAAIIDKTPEGQRLAAIEAL
jgi:hypothetical protein